MSARYVSKTYAALSTLPDYVLYRHGGLVFPAQCAKRHRHNIDSFHQARAGGKGRWRSFVSSSADFSAVAHKLRDVLPSFVS